MFADGDIGKRLAINSLNVIGRKQRHLRILFCQMESDIRDHHAQRQCFNADFFVGIFPFCIEKTQNIGMMSM
ncbi:Uncharacterised protein [Shigella sonnei]|nr:Uncharacterised protein [Shigella sonnei]